MWPSLTVRAAQERPGASGGDPDVERMTGLEPAAPCLEGRHSSNLSFIRVE